MANGRTRLRVLRNSVPPEPEERFPRSTNCMAGARLRPVVLEWLRQIRWKIRSGLGAPYRRRAFKQQGLRADKANELVQLDTGRRQNDDVRGDELLTFGTVVDAGMSSDRQFAFDLRVGVDDKLKLVGILVAIQRERKLGRIDVGDGAGYGRGFRRVRR